MSAVSVLVVLALAAVVYTYVGYPVLVGVLAHLRRRDEPRQSSGIEPTVSVCMSMHGGAEHLPAKLDSVLGQSYPRDLLEVLVYLDGPSDDSERIVREYAQRDPRVKWLKGETRQGKPTALNRLCECARGEVLLMTDLRQPLHPDATRELVRVLADPRVGAVSGDLRLEGAVGAGAYWRYEKQIRRSEARLGSMVGVSGSIYAIRKRDFPTLPPDVLLDDMWVPSSVALNDKRVVFADRAVAYDRAFDDDHEFRRKVRTLAGNYQLLTRMPRLLHPFANPTWFQLMSHKVMRLLCPWALFVLFVASWSGALLLPPGLERNLLALLALGQTAFYLLAIAGPLAGKLGKLARTFVVLNVAAVVGLWRYARGAQQVTW